MEQSSIHLALAKKEDHEHLEVIRQLAFKPIFESFKSILGPNLYSIAQEKEDNNQAEILSSMFEPGSPWTIYSFFEGELLIGFVTIKIDNETKLGEIGLNAVHPDHSGRGLGTKMYELAVQKLKEAGMLAAQVATGGDPSHLAARRAYEKAGFDRQIPSVWFCREI